MDGTPCPRSGLRDSHVSGGAPDGKASVSLSIKAAVDERIRSADTMVTVAESG